MVDGAKDRQLATGVKTVCPLTPDKQRLSGTEKGQACYTLDSATRVAHDAKSWKLLRLLDWAGGALREYASGIENPAHHLVGLVHGQDNNFDSWDCLSNLARRLKPV
jgi:hypothetical protein